MFDRNRGKYPQARHPEIVLWVVAAVSLAILMPFAADRLGVIHGRREALDTIAEKACAESLQDRCQVAVAKRAAYAADDVVDLAIWQFFAGIVGIGFVGLTLKATRDAVKEANAATETAGKALLITERSAELQLRPYVYVSRIFFAWIWDVNDPQDDIEKKRLVAWDIVVHWKNSGQTPARDITIQTYVEERSNGTLCPFDSPPFGIAEPIGSIGPNQDTINTVRLQMELLERVWRGESELHYWAVVRYNDGFPKSKQHRTEHHHRLLVDSDPKLRATQIRNDIVPGFNESD